MTYYYCKYCGRRTSDPYILTSGYCSQSPTKKHVLYEGGEKEEYTCKHCGRVFRDLYLMTHTRCSNSPTGNHEPALI